MPKFYIDFSGLKRDFETFEFLEDEFMTTYCFAQMKSLHFVSKQEVHYVKTWTHMQFENPKVIIHDQGHRPPKKLDKEALKSMTVFLIEQLRKKYGHAQTNQVIQELYRSLSTSKLSIEANQRPKL